jgi:hypothetical protein
LKLRRLCEHAAGESSSPAEYFARLGEYGVQVKPRHSTLPGHEDELTGYAVGLKGHSNAAGDDVVWISGSKVSKDGSLSLPKLQARWSEGQRSPATALSPPEREQIWSEATQATAAAVKRLQGLAGHDVGNLSDDIARSAADLLHSAASVLEPTFRDPSTGRLVAGSGPVTEAARAYDRAQRVPYAGAVRPTRGGADLRLSAIGLGMLVAAKSDQAAQRIIFMMVAKMLMESIAEIRIGQLRLEAARAAKTAAQQLERGIGGSFEPSAPEWYRAMIRNEAAEVLAGRDPRVLPPSDTLQPPTRGRGR